MVSDNGSAQQENKNEAKSEAVAVGAAESIKEKEGQKSGLALQWSIRPVTLSILCLSLVVYGLQALNAELVLSWLHFPTFRASETFMQPWRYLSPAFLHFSHLHIGFNLLWWWMLASLVEVFQGRKALISLFLLTALLSNTAQFLYSDQLFGGLSGVVYGLFGYLWLYGKLYPKSRFKVPGVIMVQILLWMVLGFTGWLDEWIGPMANMAHLGGFIVGLLAALMTLNHPPRGYSD